MSKEKDNETGMQNMCDDMEMNNESEILENRFLSEVENIGIDITSEQMDSFRIYYKLLDETNKVMNLTAITGYSDVLTKHFLDSLLIIKALKKANVLMPFSKESIIDVGTGAGFPGIPLKICFPETKITLLDSLNKRVSFLKDVINSLKLKSISTVHGRSEDVAADKQFRAQYDYSVSRAVANLSTLSEYCIPFLKKSGTFVAYKSGNIEEELLSAKKAVTILGGEISDVVKIKLPGTEAERSFVIIKKTKETPRKFPRKAGTPGREPL